MHSNGIREIKRGALEKLALRFLPAAQDIDGAAEVVRQVEVRSGLMVERSIDTLTFSHLTFQEFLVVDYFMNEPEARFDVDDVSDWPAWREPLLLMCGMDRHPRRLVQQLFEVQPALAIEAIAELDPAFIDADIHRLVGGMLERVRKGEFGASLMLPVLMGLLSLEGNPFGEQLVPEFMAAVTGGRLRTR